ncbi:hypothetical protein DFJ58DRAFT_795293 [Suillus subalutaceus]|uniref:uncharacterized protein n=1 Tax=Suillus subalutaceus TaxID=48586 RepID=UPI001B85D044|nr:uncharacterized protein DFJ58DRAFT_795293 [Suillus subalutaceus]KAG1849141.1 hypothetical protein DFJ58DRAFT_795293 [Suillus subalutaceus]
MPLPSWTVCLLLPLWGRLPVVGCVPVITILSRAVLLFDSHNPQSALPHIWNTQPARSLYRWLFYLLCSPPPSPLLSCTTAHTGSLTPECLVNDYVDHIASSAQHSGGVLPSVPWVFGDVTHKREERKRY